jgi:tight adherence protein B
MGFVLLTFAGILALVLGIYWVGVVRPERQAQHHLLKRLRDGTKVRSELKLAKKARQLSEIPAVNEALTRAGGFSRTLERLIARAGLSINVGTVVLASAVLSLGTWIVIARLTHWWGVGLVAGAGAGYLPFAWLRMKAQKRVMRFEEQFPEAIDLISRALRAGHAFTTGLAMVAEEAPDPIKSEFRVLYDQQNFGMPLPLAMRDFADRIPLLDARFFVTAVLTQREAGGNLAEILDNLATVIRERFRVKRQVRVVTAHARITGWVLVFLPVVLAAAILAVTPSHIETLVNDPLGTYMILTAIALQTIGTLLIRKLVNIEY